MSFLKNIFQKKQEPIKSNQEFWRWFTENEKAFYEVVKNRGRIHEDFLNKISPKLDELKPGFYFLTGMADDNKVELVLTADGAVEHIAFVEELVAIAPGLENWLFTALKPALEISDVYIEMAGYKFSTENLFFYAEEYADMPDEIDIKIIHDNLTEENRKDVTTGCYIFLDNFLGELNFATTIDNLAVVAKDQAEKELIPIDKLKAYLIWREKEFIEKYEGIRHSTDEDSYSTTKATLKDGGPLMGLINTTVMQWEAKASHPWIAVVEIKYDGISTNGLPNDKDYQELDNIENKLMAELKDTEGYLNIGRETGGNQRVIYFACKDFRKPSKLLYHIQQIYQGVFEIDYNIYKDKYWSSLDHLVPSY